MYICQDDYTVFYMMLSMAERRRTVEENEKKNKDGLLGRRGEIDINASLVSDDSDYLVSGADGDAGVFVESISEVTADDMCADTSKKRFNVGRLVENVFDKLVMLCAVGVFVYCVINLIVLTVEQNAGAAYYDEYMQEYQFLLDPSASVNGAVTMAKSKSAEAFVAGVSQPDSGIVIEESEYNEELELMKAKLAALQDIYPDVYGYIMIEDTKISYPIVQGEDNDFYLDHAFTGEAMKVGSIFADYRLKDYVPSNRNLVLYGHNSSNGEMFADVMKFVQSEKFFNTHNIYIYTTTGLYVYEPFNLAVFRYDYQYFRTYFGTSQTFVDFVNEMQSQSQYSKRIEVGPDDRIITLSTCTKLGISSLRYCLQGVLVEVQE